VHQCCRRELYIEKYNNVSILFADIQNFTPLTTTLSAQQLVETLNDLFGKFDDAAKVSLDLAQ
jgi:class 3 adenylate cyclase